AAATRARQICATHGVDHEVLEEVDVARRLDMKTSLTSFYEHFSQVVGTNADHFFGTFLISRIARSLCREIGVEDYCLGFNREDVFAELLFALVNGRRP